MRLLKAYQDFGRVLARGLCVKARHWSAWDVPNRPPGIQRASECSLTLAVFVAQSRTGVSEALTQPDLVL